MVQSYTKTREIQKENLFFLFISWTSYMIVFVARAARTMLVQKSEWELNELMLLLKVATSTISMKSRLHLTHLIVSQRH